MKAHGQLRRSQIITTYGPGALIDLPKHSAIVGGLDTWPKTGDLEEIVETRLARKLQIMTGVTAPRLYAPPPDSNDPQQAKKGIGAWRFPEWFVVQEYVGRRPWNRQHAVKHPDTGRRRMRLNPSSAWIWKDVPELRIVDDDLWQAVKARQASTRHTMQTGIVRAAAEVSVLWPDQVRILRWRVHRVVTRSAGLFQCARSGNLHQLP